jgi:hypothetical protein
VKTRYVPQRMGCDCAVACLAMASQESYEAVIANLRDKDREALTRDEGLYYEADFEYLWKLGYDPQWEKLENGWLPDCDRAILTVPSKNREGKLHAVFWDGEEIHDPAISLRYEKDEALKTATLVIRVQMLAQ